MITFGVHLQKQKSLEEKMQKLGIYEKDILEKFIRSQGKGGQNLNKTATCVYLKHLPTQIEVKCQTERSQMLNRFLARRLLANKIEQLVLGKKSEEQQRIEKIKRQKRKRSKRAKEKLLENKHYQSKRKENRKKVGFCE
ncbi:MAG: peptide chain release factor-like protein [Elusimicrobiota bacterium]